MEHFWLAVAIGSGIWAIYAFIALGAEEGRKWSWLPLIALAMFLFRRFTRKKLEAMEKREP
mgnify:CR=1 FL=1